VEQAVNLDFDLWPKQIEAINSPARFILYGGAAGSGKSHLDRVKAILRCLEVAGLQVYLFRRRYPDLIKNYMEGPTSFHAMLAPLVRAGLCKIVELEIRFINGSRIFLCHCQHEKDVWNYAGPEFHLLILAEATQFTEFQIRFLCGRVRMPDVVKVPVHLKASLPGIHASGNPGGPSHGFFKSKFVDVYQSLLASASRDTHQGKDVSQYPIWKMADLDGGWTAQFIPARLEDNPSIDPVQYRAALMGLKRKDLVDALLEGRWDIPLGAFLPECDERRHVIKPFSLPQHWFRFRAFDWGSASPFAVIWWAVADGSTGHPEGSLIAYREWYGASPLDPTRGLALSNRQMCEGIREKTLDSEIIQGTVTDSRPFQSGGGITIAEEFEQYGVLLQLGDVKPGSRIQGWQQLRSRLIGHDGVPAIYFFENCRETWRTLTQLQTDQHDPEDADTDGEDHAPDAVSLACKARPYIKKAPPKPVPITEQRLTMDNVINAHIRLKRAADAIRR
jgi:hypothetical protein